MSLENTPTSLLLANWQRVAICGELRCCSWCAQRPAVVWTAPLAAIWQPDLRLCWCLDSAGACGGRQGHGRLQARSGKVSAPACSAAAHKPLACFRAGDRPILLLEETID